MTNFCGCCNSSMEILRKIIMCVGVTLRKGVHVKHAIPNKHGLWYIYNIVLKKNLFSHIYGMGKQVNASTNNIYLIHIRKYKTQ